jgi:hypothetical protein
VLEWHAAFKNTFRKQFTQTMLKRFTFFLSLQIAFISSTHLSGQTVMRSSMGCIGATYTENGLILRQTIGQSSNTTVISNGEFVIRQGFQQPITTVNSPEANIPVDFTLYPNPAHHYTSIVFKEQVNPYSIIIRNINGAVLAKFDNQTLQSRELILEDYMSGVYIVTIVSNERIGIRKLVVRH